MPLKSTESKSHPDKNRDRRKSTAPLISKIGYDNWNNSQLEKRKYLEEALVKYDTGKSKSFIILHF